MAAVSATVLGKRRQVDTDLFVLRFTSSATSTPSFSSKHDGPQQQEPTTSTGPPIIINGKLVEATKKRYRCTFQGCVKAYTKPSRLEEHERSHTGQRPFLCETCGKSYLRETHLHAHNRSHLPSSARPFVCERNQCDKRFWTAQHLSVHHSWHDGAKPYKCTSGDCQEAFAKHHQLRAHICAEHAPAGTKPYRCEHEGCSKSFDTNQHLRTHQKTHDERRYACVHPTCLGEGSSSAPYFPTWSSLQSHIRTAHPPTCTQPSCKGRTFSNHANLRAHLKLHEQRDHELAMLDQLHDMDESRHLPYKKQRRGGEYGRELKCEIASCDKDFKSKKALGVHIKVTHLGARDFVCHHADCARAFGYKHLLQRHLSKAHETDVYTTTISDEEESSDDFDPSSITFDIDTITGNAYAKRAEANLRTAKVLRCPFPVIQDLVDTNDLPKPIPVDASACDYVFSRSYDLRRHLRASHAVCVDKDTADDWVAKQKNRLLNIGRT